MACGAHDGNQHPWGLHEPRLHLVMNSHQHMRDMTGANLRWATDLESSCVEGSWQMPRHRLKTLAMSPRQKEPASANGRSRSKSCTLPTRNA